MRRAFLALGSNLGDRRALLAAAVAALDDVVAVSPVYETDPMGPSRPGPLSEHRGGVAHRALRPRVAEGGAGAGGRGRAAPPRPLGAAHPGRGRAVGGGRDRRRFRHQRSPPAHARAGLRDGAPRRSGPRTGPGLERRERRRRAAAPASWAAPEPAVERRPPAPDGCGRAGVLRGDPRPGRAGRPGPHDGGRCTRGISACCAARSPRPM